MYQFVLSTVVFSKSKNCRPDFKYTYICLIISSTECVPVFGLLFLSIQDDFSLDVGL